MGVQVLLPFVSLVVSLDDPYPFTNLGSKEAEVSLANCLVQPSSCEQDQSIL